MSIPQIPSTRPRLLFLVHRVPYPPDKGDRIRTYHLLRYLSRRASVWVACLADEPLSKADEAGLRAHCEELAVVPTGGWSRWLGMAGELALGGTASVGAFRSPALRQIVQNWARRAPFHAVLASSSSLVPYLQIAELQGVPAVVDLIDVDSQKWLDYAAASRGPRRWLYQLEGQRLRKLESSLASWVRALTVVTEAEADLYRRFQPTDRIHAVPNGVDLEYFQAVRQKEKPGCVFVGALDYKPNIDGACWFAREIWPEIHRRHPDARLALVGRRPVPAVTQLAAVAGVDVVGQVPDVRPYVREAMVAVVPLRLARGVQNKVLEAMALGKAVVASPQTLVGLPVDPGVHLLSAATPGEWTETVERLLTDADERRRLGTAARSFVEEHHRWESCLEPFGDLLDLPSEAALASALSEK